jgi:formate hydrogenlyase subunit 3/multisubunit Na+/H+ antiporter MnhD subunit
MTGTAERRGGMNWRIVGSGGAAALLATPLVAMRFTGELNCWAGDFVLAALLFGDAAGRARRTD